MSLQQLDVIIGLLKQSNAGFSTVSIPDMRAGFEKMTSVFPIDPTTALEPVHAGSVKAEWVSASTADPMRALLYLHGGGYIIGSINTHRAFASWLSKACKAPVLLIEYRLAPEHPFPAAVEDALEAYRWLLEKEGLSPQKIAIAGDSAGGGLTLATLVAIRDAKLPLPSAAACLSPWVDLEALGESMATKASEDPLVQKDGLVQSGLLYLNGQDPRTPLAAPLYADFTGLPPLLIQVGTAETLLDDSIRIAERARSAGVQVNLESWDKMIHVWQMFAPMLEEGQQAIDKIGEFIQKHMHEWTKK